MPSLSLPDEASAAAALRVAIPQIEFARNYVLELLEATPEETWFTIPPGATTSVAWQIGHLAVSQYGLLMFRQRGRQPEDLELIPGRFRKRYSRGSAATDGPADQPSASELVERLATIHARSLEELGAAEPARLLDPIDPPYALYPIKLGAVLFCPLHEQLHAGQIGLLRRLLGLDPIH